MTQEEIAIARLVPMDIFPGEWPVRIDLAYAGPASFCGMIYRPQARLWLYEDLAHVVLLAARICQREFGCGMVLYDGLRTVSAQALMRESDIVKAHPHWLEGENRVLSNPGQGGHPRGMAIDLTLEDQAGMLLDMGTAFDEMPEGDTGPGENRAHRLFEDLPSVVKENRLRLENVMLTAAAMLNVPLVPLPSEWWDFRLPPEVYNRFRPLDECDLPPQMRMTDCPGNEGGLPDFPESHITALSETARKRLRFLL